VVVSQSQNEVEDMRQKGLDIAPHRERIIREDLETKFKDSKDPSIVFVVAMDDMMFPASRPSTPTSP